MKNIREEILKRVDIVEVVSSYVTLERKGQNYNCLCPFHEDNNPSLVVSPEKQIFKCFVCETAGTAIEFVSKFEKIPYNRALSKLGNKVGLKVEENKKKNKYNEVLEDVNFYYTKTLTKSDIGVEALKYLKEKRQLDDSIIEKFQLGYSPKFSEALYNFLGEKIKEGNYSAVEIDSLKIFKENNYDVLNNRVTFPLFDENSNIVGYSGRLLGNNSSIKYLNSKESKIFHKNKVLYNFNNVIEAKEKKVLLLEGFFDVITAYKYGVEYAIASMGTAFGIEHINLLKKNKIKTIYLGFDSDLAGQKALYKSGDLLIKNGFEVKVISYGEYKDLDECLNSKKYDIKLMIENADDYLIYLTKNNKEKLSMEQKIKLIEKISKTLKFYKEDLKKSFIVDEIAKILEINRDILLPNKNNESNKKKEKTISYKQEPTINYDYEPDLNYDYEPDINYEDQNVINNDQVYVSNKKIVQEDEEKIIVYLAAISYEKFLEIDSEITSSNYKFNNYEKEYSLIRSMYIQNNEVDIITLLDEAPNFAEIELTAKIYGQKNLLESLNIKNYFNKEKKRKAIKLKKLF